MAEVLVEFEGSIAAPDGTHYAARACGSEMPDGKWQGWIEFIPPKGEPVRSARETTQPNRQDTVYWATGLTPVFLEGSLKRALNPTVRPLARPIDEPFFDGPAQTFVTDGSRTESILDPFSVYRKGEAFLRRQLSALAGWHLVNIIRHYGLSEEDSATLGAHEPSRLVDLIVAGVRRPSNRRAGSQTATRPTHAVRE